VLQRCDELALCTERAGEITRTFCSGAMREAHQRVERWMRDAGLTCRIDPAGNLIGRRSAAKHDGGRVLLIGSHLDSVVNAGRYDGVLGVMLGLALAEFANEAQAQWPFALDVIGFCEEEGVRFATPYLGSRALVGELTPELLARRDSGGQTMAEVVRAFGGDPDRLAECCYDPQEVLAYVEPHIEQGPVLEREGLPLGVVTGIAGQIRGGLTFRGRAGHAGTTPMALRQDALVAAAQWIVEVERFGRSQAGLVATVGRIETAPNVGNVIPGEVRALLDVRHLDDAVRQAAFDGIAARAVAICQERGIAGAVDWTQQEPSVRCDARCTESLSQAVVEAGVRPFCLPSGAGHDAVLMARRFPACMLFIRCAGGISHHPEENVAQADVAAALDALWRFAARLAAEVRSAS
jgi:allantoate deiminase